MKKIESSLVPRAFILLGVLTATDGCARHAMTSNAKTANANAGNAAAAAATNSSFDLIVSKLPHAKLPAALMSRDAPGSISRDEKIAGVTGDEFDGQYQLTGVADRGKAMASTVNAITDPPDDSFCVGVEQPTATDRVMMQRKPPPSAMFGIGSVNVSSKSSDAAMKPTPPVPMDPIVASVAASDAAQASTRSSLLDYLAPAPYVQERIAVERVDGDKLTMIRGWAEQSGGMRQVGKVVVGMQPITSLGGVDVHAFLDESTTPNIVNVVVKRPALKNMRVRAKPFLGTLPDGTFGNASCRHVRIALPLVKGNGASSSFVIAVETEKGARAIKLNVSTVWMPSDPSARLATRLEWDGPETPDYDGRNMERIRRRRASMSEGF